MPHVNSSGGDDLASTDEVKVYKDEGEEVEEKRSSENLSEDKLGLVTESEEVCTTSEDAFPLKSSNRIAHFCHWIRASLDCQHMLCVSG